MKHGGSKSEIKNTKCIHESFDKAWKELYVELDLRKYKLNKAEVKKLLTSKKLAIPYKTSTSITIKNVSGNANNVDSELVKSTRPAT